MSDKDIKDQDIFYRILSEHKELSSLPQIMAEVLKVADDPDSSASDLARVILKDPSLTARLLRVVNSPFWGQTREITTINEAVVTLGMKTVTAIALSASVYDVISGFGVAIDRKRFWRHSLEVALAARLLAEKTGHKPSEEAFVAGLLHDIGMLVLEDAFPDEFRRIWKLVEAGEDHVTCEQRAWGTDHARAGQFLLNQWGLPGSIGEAVRDHHRTYAAGEDVPETPLALIVNLANSMSRFRFYNMPPPDPVHLENRDSIAARLGLSPDDVNHMAENLISEVIKESGYLEIEIGGIEDLLRDANRLLYRQFIDLENLLRENRTMKQKISRNQARKAALESLKTLAGTYGHYIKDAGDVIREQAQQVEHGIFKGEMTDPDGHVAMSMQVINNGIDAVFMILSELKKLTTFESIINNDRSYLVETESKIRKQLAGLDKVGAGRPV